LAIKTLSLPERPEPGSGAEGQETEERKKRTQTSRQCAPVRACSFSSGLKMGHTTKMAISYIYIVIYIYYNDCYGEIDDQPI
jgi:hypothetical protein